MNYAYIELNRTFHELSKYAHESDDNDISQAFHVGDRLSWDQLLKEYRVVILSEAGSGKTSEIRNVALQLRAQGKAAFFIRLEHIANHFDDAFEVGDLESFSAWVASGEEGWLLLDSIDEARLRNPNDFELAIRKIGKKINAAKERVHIVLTGRTSAWRPKTDLAHCSTHLPYTAISTPKPGDESESVGPHGRVKIETGNADADQSVFKIVALDDLSSEQIKSFLQEHGIQNHVAFLDAVERADAWAFTSRPQDLEELVEFWRDTGRIGSRLEILQNSIDRRLSERSQDRADTRPLAPERARHGARLLAAATTLAQNPTIRVPDGAEISKGIATKSVLPDWDDKDQSTLLSRPIFDEAIYGTVRFHHRSVREYLTAEWFAGLLKNNTSRRNIESLFFRNQYGLDIVVPALRPILPWLAIFDEKIREHVRKVAPEIIFEGGDPSQLSLEVRRSILHEVCEQMAASTTGRSMRDRAAVQRFANPDLTDDIRALIRKYSGDDDLTAFLLRMVWLGQLAGAMPEVMELALSPNAEEYVRSSAFRALRAVGSVEEQEWVRTAFLAESKHIRRNWLAILLDGLQPTEQTADWLLGCLAKSLPKERYSADQLTDEVTQFINTSPIELLPKLAVGMNRLLGLPPVIERRHCDVSQQFQWLLVPAARAFERLCPMRHPVLLADEALTILHKISAMRSYDSYELSGIKANFGKLVSAWPELNRASFWSSVAQARRYLGKKGADRLINFWQARTFDAIWQFSQADFDYACEEIARQEFLDNKLVALSLAFTLYQEAKRPTIWRIRLKKLVAGQAELDARLRTFLKPPAQDQETRRWKQQEKEWKRRQEAQQAKEAAHHEEWKRHFQDNIGEIRRAICENPGIFSNPLHYLSEEVRRDSEHSGRWSGSNWRALVPTFGEEVARCYRDGAIQYWRAHTPQLRSEGAPLNETTYAVIFGLAGLEMEANETDDWPSHLTEAEVRLACRYASFELNGFPTWFPKLLNRHTELVTEFLIQEIGYELSIATPDTESHYIIDDVCWSGQWAWEQIGPHIYRILDQAEPVNLAHLDKLLQIMRGSSLSDNLMAELASRKCQNMEDRHHIARWFAVWVGVAPETAIPALELEVGAINSVEERTNFMMVFITHLLDGRRGGKSISRQAFHTPQHLKSLYLLVHNHIRREEDIDRAGEGVYSPGLRDEAQDARNSLFTLLNRISGKEAFLAMLDIAKVHPEEGARPWMLLHAREKAERDGDISPWRPEQVREFHNTLERTPVNHKELAELAVLRLLDLKDSIERGDNSVAGILKTVSQETLMRNYIAHELRERANGRYSVTQEEELADAKRPDLRFLGVGFDAPVPVELKLADNNWTGPALFERLRNQLCGDYLRDSRSNRGIFVLVYRGEKIGWEVPNGNNRVDFGGLVAALRNYWQEISGDFPGVDEIVIVGIDVTARMRRGAL